MTLIPNEKNNSWFLYLITEYPDQLIRTSINPEIHKKSSLYVDLGKLAGLAPKSELLLIGVEPEIYKKETPLNPK